MKCIHCQGPLKRGATPLHVDRYECHVVVDKAPAWVCEQCGEPYFDEKAVEQIEELVRSIEEKAKALTM